VIAVGDAVQAVQGRRRRVTHCNGEPDTTATRCGIWAYDQPESIGWYGEEAVVGDWQIIPRRSRAASTSGRSRRLPLRAPTAYHLWRRALGIYRIKVGRGQRSVLNVLGFGGGVSELFLMLAKHEGHRAIFCSGSPERRKHLESLGIESIDQKAFNRFTGKDDVKNFNKHVKGMTGGDGVQIVCDMLRGPCSRGPRRARAHGRERLGGLAARHRLRLQLGEPLGAADHARPRHYETVEACNAATELYGSVFKPTVHREIYKFEDLPRAMAEMHENVQTGSRSCGSRKSCRRRFASSFPSSGGPSNDRRHSGGDRSGRAPRRAHPRRREGAREGWDPGGRAVGRRGVGGLRRRRLHRGPARACRRALPRRSRPTSCSRSQRRASPRSRRCARARPTSASCARSTRRRRAAARAAAHDRVRARARAAHHARAVDGRALSQANLAGYRAGAARGALAAEDLPDARHRRGTIQPARVFVIGAGVAGLQAIATGAPARRDRRGLRHARVVAEQVQSLGARFVTLELDSGDAQDAAAMRRRRPRSSTSGSAPSWARSSRRATS
jgi:NADPH:quinone reductase-like Zn-dependent oxidoreductase